METIKDVWYAIVEPDNTITKIFKSRAEAEDHTFDLEVERVHVTITRI